MRMKMTALLSTVLFAAVAFGNIWNDVTLKGVTDKANPVGSIVPEKSELRPRSLTDYN